MKFRLLISLSLLFLLSGCMAHQQQVQPLLPSATGLSLPQLTVQAEARLEVIPDQLRLRLGIVTEAAEAAEAVRDNNRRMSTLMMALDELGLDREDLATGQFQITPQWSQPPRPTPANWQREIVGYRVNNDLWVATNDIDLAGELLEMAYKSGVNQVGNLQFSVADPEHHHQQAMAVATRKALEQARVLAAGAGVELGRVLSISLDPAVSYGGVQPLMAEVRLAAVDTVPITPGKVEVKAGVVVVFEILPPVKQ